MIFITVEIDEVLVEGSMYKVCKNYISCDAKSCKKVQQYNEDKNPLFQKYKLDSQLQDILIQGLILNQVDI